MEKCKPIIETLTTEISGINYTYYIESEVGSKDAYIHCVILVFNIHFSANSIEERNQKADAVIKAFFKEACKTIKITKS